MEVVVDVVYAFTKNGRGGNAAGVVLDASKMKDETLQTIAKQVNFSETVFFCGTSKRANHTIRFFAPEREVPLCGHGTIAAYAHIFALGLEQAGSYQMLTKAGVQDITISEDGLISMSQNLPTFGNILPVEEVAPLLNLSPKDFATDIPIQIVSTGLNKILAPIASLSAIKNIQPDYEKIKQYSLKHDVTGIYTFTLETEENATAHCRNFAPAVGILEDAATGTSCAALSCLLFKYAQITAEQAVLLRYEQGYEIEEPSEILSSLKIEQNTIAGVQVMGKGTKRDQITLQIEE